MKLNFKRFKSPAGKIIIFTVIMIIAYIGLQYVFVKRDTLKKHAKKAISKPFEVIYKAPMSDISSDKKDNEQIEETKKADSPEKKDNKPESPNNSKRKIPPSGAKSKSNQVNFLPNNGHKGRRSMPVKPFTPPIGLYTAKPSSIPPDPKKQSAPFGQLLRCELIQTVMTSNLQTPIIAMVTKPLWWNGKEIIPAGVIIHGVAASSPMRDRVGTGNKWVLVWPHRNKWNGKRLVLNAIALACDRTENSWSRIDGSAGIKGDVISNENQKRMYAYMASFISGLGEGMVSENEDTTGSTTTKTTGGTFSDALGKAFQKSASDISDQLFKELSQSMFYVEARAGTEFYLYIKQDIIISEARKGKLITQTSSRRKRK